MVFFGLKTHFKKIFLGYFYPPTLPMQKNRVKMVPKQVFIGGALTPPLDSMSIPEDSTCKVKDICLGLGRLLTFVLSFEQSINGDLMININ